MYSIGLLFGLGFDTVTEVGLLVLAAGAGMPVRDRIDERWSSSLLS